MATVKRQAIVTFQGGQLTVRNAFDYPETDEAGNPTGRSLKARAGVFLALPNQRALDLSGLELDQVLAPEIVKRLKANKLAQSILAENDQAALNGADH